MLQIITLHSSFHSVTNNSSTSSSTFQSNHLIQPRPWCNSRFNRGQRHTTYTLVRLIIEDKSTIQWHTMHTSSAELRNQGE
jgi:hypothetical protein